MKMMVPLEASVALDPWTTPTYDRRRDRKIIRMHTTQQRH